MARYVPELNVSRCTNASMTYSSRRLRPSAARACQIDGTAVAVAVPEAGRR